MFPHGIEKTEFTMRVKNRPNIHFQRVMKSVSVLLTSFLMTFEARNGREAEANKGKSGPRHRWSKIDTVKGRSSQRERRPKAEAEET